MAGGVLHDSADKGDPELVKLSTQAINLRA